MTRKTTRKTTFVWCRCRECREGNRKAAWEMGAVGAVVTAAVVVVRSVL